MISLTTWEFVLGLISIISFGLNIYQFFSKRSFQHHSDGIYSQLWNIIVEIDENKVNNLTEIKRLINQVRIQTIAFSYAIKAKQRLIYPWDFGKIYKRNSLREEVDWAIEKHNFRPRAIKINLHT
jgi:hypothetical protein